MKNTITILGIIGIIIVAVVILSTTSENTDQNTQEIDSSENIFSENNRDELNQGDVSDGEEVSINAGSFEEWSPEKIALAETGDVVIFFHASWCPSCRTLAQNIRDNASDIPENLTILQADYDSEIEMRRQYGVTTQHTLVQVNAQGEMIKKWSGGSRLVDVINSLE